MEMAGGSPAVEMKEPTPKPLMWIQLFLVFPILLCFVCSLANVLFLVLLLDGCLHIIHIQSSFVNVFLHLLQPKGWACIWSILSWSHCYFINNCVLKTGCLWWHSETRIKADSCFDYQHSQCVWPCLFLPSSPSTCLEMSLAWVSWGPEQKEPSLWSLLWTTPGSVQAQPAKGTWARCCLQREDVGVQVPGVSRWRWGAVPGAGPAGASLCHPQPHLPFTNKEKLLGEEISGSLAVVALC